MALSDSNYANLAAAVIPNPGATTDTTITISAANGATFPTTAPFYATIMPTIGVANSTNSEIVKVTAISTSGSNTTFTVTRAQRNTSAISWSANGAVIAQAIYTQDVPNKTSDLTNDSNFITGAGTIGSSVNPVYSNNGAITSCTMSASGKRWGCLPWIGDGGTFEVGRYLDFHASNDDTSDFSARLEATGSNILKMWGNTSDIQLTIDSSSVYSLREIAGKALKVDTDVVKVAASSGTWSKDFNNIVFPHTVGTAILSSSSGNVWANNPTGSTVATEHWYLIQEQFNANSNSYATQICSQVNVSDGNLIWYRNCRNNTWSSWQRIAISSDLTSMVKTGTTTSGITQLTDNSGTSIYPALTTDNVATANITDSSVTTAKINDSAVTTAKINDGAVTTAKIAANAVTTAKLDMSGLLDYFYPVGSYYETSDTSFDPNVSWGGTWVEDSQGKVTVSQDSGTFSTVGDTGGAETHRHDFKIGTRFWFGAVVGDNFTSHDQGAWSYSQSKFSKDATQQASSVNLGRNSGLQTATSDVSPDVHISTGDTDTGSSLQPYVVVKRWHRTA